MDSEAGAAGVGEASLRVALGLAVGLVLADSSVVVLALPEIYRELDASVSAVTWVLIAFNLVLAAAAVPAALATRRLRSRPLVVFGLVVFASASLACGVSDGIAILIAARCAQAVGGALAVCAALELLPGATGSERSAARIWAGAGAAGAALGPGAGGLLTELVSWQSIFLLQVPLALSAAVPVARGRPTVPEPAAGTVAGRPHVAANVALCLVSAALAAALFLTVLLLIEGWRLSPIAAAAAVSAVPLFALLAGPLARRVEAAAARAAAGMIMLAGGLFALGLLPDASILLTLPPQALLGCGLALALSALTEAALEGRSPQAIHGGWTIAARHAGVVAGLLVLTPVFTADLETQREHAEQAGVAALLDSRVPAGALLELAGRIEERIEAERDKVPVLGPAFEPLPEEPEDRAALLESRERIEGEVDAAATHAFSASFLIGAAFALAALLPVGLSRRQVEL